jgi:hypothetical protein
MGDSRAALMVVCCAAIVLPGCAATLPTAPGVVVALR